MKLPYKLISPGPKSCMQHLPIVAIPFEAKSFRIPCNEHPSLSFNISGINSNFCFKTSHN